MKVYFNDWSSWDEVSASFSGEYTVPKKPTIKKPDEVIFAAYTYECYSGDAFVIYRDGDKYFTVDGGHCSCYGLEGQWSPEDYTLPLLIDALEKMNYGVINDHKDRIVRLLKGRL